MKNGGRKVMILNYRRRNRGTGRLNDLLKVTCPIWGRAKLHWTATLVVKAGGKKAEREGIC